MRDSAEALFAKAEADRRRLRLAMAARIAAGMAANPHVCEGYDWKGQVARDAYSIAGMLLTLHDTGGC